jgi:hypothetical protein
MAVTRQEEMLLAALRMKRAMMRESILEDLEEEMRQEEQQQRGHQGSLQRSQTSQAAYSKGGRQPSIGVQRSSSSPAPRILERQHLLMGSPLSAAERESLSPLEGEQERVPLYLDASILRSHDYHPASHKYNNSINSVTSTSTGSNGTADNKRAPRTARSSNYYNARRLTTYSAPAQMQDDDDEEDEGEPSPDLSDFMDLDNSTSEDDDVVPEDQPHTPAQSQFPAQFSAPGSQIPHKLVTPRTSSRNANRRVEPRRLKTATAVPMSPVGASVRVVDASESRAEDVDADVGAGIPRPDSPVSPDGPTAMASRDEAQAARNKAARLSAVGRVGIEVGWWGDDG